MNRANEAYDLMAAGRMNCAQTVFYSFCTDYELDRPTALRLAQGFGGGMGRTGNTCGAVTGAYMVLGLAHPAPVEKPREGIEKTYALINEFNRLFEAKHGSLICKKLIGYDLSSPEERAKANENYVFTAVCPGLVKDAVTILETLLKQP
jgi:C_GCAxxG_C_C family probable redox protein